MIDLKLFNLDGTTIGQNQIGGQKVQEDQREIYPDKLDPGNVLIRENGKTERVLLQTKKEKILKEPCREAHLRVLLGHSLWGSPDGF